VVAGVVMVMRTTLRNGSPQRVAFGATLLRRSGVGARLCPSGRDQTADSVRATLAAVAERARSPARSRALRSEEAAVLYARGVVGVLIGFAIIAVVIAVGYVVARVDLLGSGAQRALSRLAFFVLQPALLFTVLAEADVRRLFSSVLPISALSAVAMFAIFVAVAALRRRPLVETVVGAQASGYVNANNIGLPVSLYVLGDASSSAPVILLQLIVFTPIVLAILDIATGARTSIGRTILRPLANPMIIGTVLGLIVALLGVKLPDPVLAPFQLIGGAAVPVVLLSFGMSLRGTRALAPGTERASVILASALKLVVMPVVAWLLGAFAFGLSGHELFVVVALAALPAAQNVFNYAQRYGAAVVLARDVVLITTVLSIAALVVIALLLAPR